ncbi:cholinesterase 1-like [Lingula anatina]|uniref:Cholinesterase 1-like n=1 Tax=Lingula anatina TaxID=7574 RepID=A0A1S3H3D9_LINAN|nr:cholinesterase 1-like isoform X1 [Lingula anatina]XP_013380475.1 cholinesterase 1-like isoform X2 [Lingula anatina]XP_013380483.2 cholinesterase 1-like [Lingula anatina]|eukprot:XP_013380467.1 cholinesterase 1-like isoform X1 [Lingula anatina]
MERDTSVLVVLLCLTLTIAVTSGQPLNWNQWSSWGNDPNPVTGNDFYYYQPEVQIKYGRVRGYSIQYRGHNWRYGYRKYVNVFLGVPYAKPPIGTLRFRPPEEPDKWMERDVERYKTWDATYYRPACPQPKNIVLQQHLPHHTNTSEDCLYMNIFTPNITYYPYYGKRWPVLVYIHGGEFTHGSAQMYPGTVLAQRQVVLVTFNYRLGPLGFLSTEDAKARGNYGMLDQVRALEFIRENIWYFYGDPNNVMIFGHDAGAVSVGLHLVSDKSRGRKLFTKAAAAGGADMVEWGVIEPKYRPREYAYELGYRLGCPVDHNDHHSLIQCLRYTKSWEEITLAGLNISKREWLPAGPWAPVVDGYDGFLTDTPRNLRERGAVAPVMFLAGLCLNEGSYLIPNISPTMGKGITETEFDMAVDDFLARRRIWDIERAREAVRFEYTYWTNPDNATARTQELMHLYGDLKYGAGLDYTLKNASNLNRTYFYVFQYRSEMETEPGWRGIPHGADIPYIFGFPHMNYTFANVSSIKINKLYDGYLDRNMSDFMITVYTEFARRGNTTPDLPEEGDIRRDHLRNITWLPVNPYNLTFLVIDEYPYHDVMYRQDEFAFWMYRFSEVVDLIPVFTTPWPTPAAFRDFQIATWGLVVFGILATLIIACLAVALIRARSKYV